MKQFDFDEQQRMNLRAKAEANEYLYYRMKEIGLIGNIDEEIGIEFT